MLAIQGFQGSIQNGLKYSLHEALKIFNLLIADLLIVDKVYS